MKKLAYTIVLTLTASAAFADADPRYTDPDVVLSEMKELVETCAGMENGQINQEIFGITFTRSGDTCIFGGGGKVDENARRVLDELKLDWVGIDGEHGLWVEITN